MQTTERDRVVYLEVPVPAPPSQASALAFDLLDACRSVEERSEPLVALVLVGGGSDFWVEAIASAADCDAVDDVWSDAVRAVGRLQTPVVACLRGSAIGPAWDLALACDLRVVTSNVVVGSPEVRWGRMPSAGATQRLPRLAGLPVALRVLLLGETLRGEDLRQLGLAAALAPEAAVEAELERLLDGMRASAPIALAYAREAVRSGSELSLEEGLRLEADLAALLHTTSDRMAGIEGFLERRKVQFEGR